MARPRRILPFQPHMIKRRRETAGSRNALLLRRPVRPQARRHRHLGQSAGSREHRSRTGYSAKDAWFLFLPPHSPDLNPIEMAFAKLKALLRAKAIRTIDALWRAINEIRDLFTPRECQNYFAGRMIMNSDDDPALEGRSWRGLHRHALMAVIAYAFQEEGPARFSSPCFWERPLHDHERSQDRELIHDPNHPARGRQLCRARMGSPLSAASVRARSATLEATVRLSCRKPNPRRLPGDGAIRMCRPSTKARRRYL